MAQEIWESIVEFNRMNEIGLHKEPANTNDLPATNFWIIQSDVSCFTYGIMSLGYVIKDPNANIFLAASKRLSSHADASTT